MKFDGSIRIASNFKEDWEYVAVEADSLGEACCLAIEKCRARHWLPIKIIEIRLHHILLETEQQGDKNETT
jgi:hypothetical protein